MHSICVLHSFFSLFSTSVSLLYQFHNSKCPFYFKSVENIFRQIKVSHLFYALDVSLSLMMILSVFFVFHSCQLCLYPPADGCSHSVFINKFCLCVFSLAIRDGGGSGVGGFFLLCEDYIANAMLICMWDVRFLWKFEFEWQFVFFLVFTMSEFQCLFDFLATWK